MRNNIILLNQATGPLFIDIANIYIKEYNEVTIITGAIMPTYAELDPKIKVVFKKKFNGKKSYYRIYTWLVFFFQCLFYVSIRKKYDRYLFVSNPPILPFIGYFLFWMRKIDYDVLVYDIYPDALLNFGYITKNSYIFKLWKKLNQFTYMSASRVFTISESMKKVISRTSNEKNIEVIYPWVDTSFIKPIAKKSNWFVNKHNLLDKKVILYSGNMGVTHDLMIILEAAKVLCEKKDYRHHFLFIGDGVQRKALYKYSMDKKLINVSFLPLQEANVLPFSITAADYGIVSLGSGAEGLSIPSKLFYLLAAGCSIISISETNSEIEYLVKHNNLGISIEPNRVDDLVNFLELTTELELINFKKNARQMSNNFSIKNAELFL